MEIYVTSLHSYDYHVFKLLSGLISESVTSTFLNVF